MRIFRKILLITSISFLSISVFSQTQQNNNDKLIYQTVLKHIRWKHENYFVIQKETESYELRKFRGLETLHDTLWLYYIIHKDTMWNSIPVDTSWKQVMTEVCQLDSNEIELPDLAKYKSIYISKDSLESIFAPEKGKGWRYFNKLFPKTKSLISFSRIIYSAEKNKAILYSSQSQGWLSGSGYIYFLINENGNWKIISEQRQWIS